MVLEVFLAFRMMPLGDATTLMFSSPLFTAILSAIFLKDARFRLWKMIFITLMMAGMVLVVQPPFLFGNSMEEASATYYIGAGVAVLCAVTMSMANVIVRGPLNGVSSSALVFHTGWASLFIAIVCVISGADQRFSSSSIASIPIIDWAAIFGAAALGLSAFFMNFKAVQLIDPTIVSSIKSLEILFAFTLQVLVMGEAASALGLVGAALVSLGVFAIVIEKTFVSKFIPERFQSCC